MSRQHYQIKSVDVWLREEKTTELFTFHCPYCGYILFQHQQGINLIVPGKTFSLKEFNQMGKELEGEYKKPPIIIRCGNCKTQYNIR